MYYVVPKESAEYVEREFVRVRELFHGVGGWSRYSSAPYAADQFPWKVFPFTIAGPFESRVLAFGAVDPSQKSTHTVVFIPLARLASDHANREQARFRSDGGYVTPSPTSYNWPTPPRSLPVPWDSAFYASSFYPWHHVHMSPEDPTKVAYTPDAESAYLGRTVRTTAGRYLTRYYTRAALMNTPYGRQGIAEYGWSESTFPDHSARFESWIAMCDPSRLVVSLATTPADVEKVYRAGHHLGIDSCMSAAADNYDSHIHPTRVYAMPGSDLAVAYLGTLTDPAARCVVWPERKYYGRIYGDVARMSEGLCRAGYTPKTIFVDAHLPVVRDSECGDTDRIVMPYLDVAHGAILVDNGTRLRLLDRSGDVDVRTTCGVTYLVPMRECDHCGRDYEPGHGGASDNYCASCENSRYSCDSRNDSVWETSHTDTGYRLCESCYDNQQHSCAGCDTTFDTFGMTGTVRRQRMRDGVTDYCNSCIAECATCTRQYPADDDTCSHCAPETLADETTDAGDTEPPVTPDAPDAPRYGYTLQVLPDGHSVWRQCHTLRHYGSQPEPVAGVTLDYIDAEWPLFIVRFGSEARYRVVRCSDNVVVRDSQNPALALGGSTEVAF